MSWQAAPCQPDARRGDLGIGTVLGLNKGSLTEARGWGENLSARCSRGRWAATLTGRGLSARCPGPVEAGGNNTHPTGLSGVGAVPVSGHRGSQGPAVHTPPRPGYLY